eukprot:gene2981-3436_t
MKKFELVKVKHYQSLLLCYSIFELMLCAGPIFGWASLAFVLKKEEYFTDDCPLLGAAQSNLTSSSSTSSKAGSLVMCGVQEEKLSIGYTVGFLTAGIMSLPAGSILDSFGPRVSRILSCLLFATSAVLWGNLSRSQEYLMYPAIVTATAAGVFSGYAFLQVTAFFCDKHQSTTLSIQNGAYNASAVILQIVKSLRADFTEDCAGEDSRILDSSPAQSMGSLLIDVSFVRYIQILYEAQKAVALETLLSIYCAISGSLVLISTVLLIPSKAQLLDHLTKRNLVNNESVLDIATTHEQKSLNKSVEFMEEWNCEGASITYELNTKEAIEGDDDFMNKKSDEQTQENNDLLPEAIVEPVRIMLPSFKNSLIDIEEKQTTSWLDYYPHRDSISNNMGEQDGLKLTAYNVILHGSVMSIANHIDTQSESKSKIARRDPKQKQKSLMKILLSGIYIWHLVFSSITLIRLYFYVSTFESMLRNLANSDEQSVNKFVNIFGIGQLVGLVFTPLLGPYIDRDPKLDPNATYDDYRHWKIRRCAIALAITNTVDVIMGVAVLIPYIEAQIISIIAHILLRGFFYSVHFTYFAVVFPPEHYGKLSCLSLLIAILFGTMQYALSVLTKEKLGSNPFWSF